uniref:Copia protein n=1 Tax=Cacopsylla melanoneura TaxID=428564 RepID=A0A8D8ZML6_9HEMI
MDTTIRMDMLQEGGCYTAWRFKLDLALRVKGLYDIATGVKVKDETQSTQNVEWEKKDLEAQALIGLNVDSSIARKLANITSSHQMLKKLDLLYGKKSDVTIEGLQRQFFAYVFDSKKSAFENCIHVNQLAEELSAMGDTIKESWIMTRMLGMLPSPLEQLGIMYPELIEISQFCWRD